MDPLTGGCTPDVHVSVCLRPLWSWAWKNDRNQVSRYGEPVWVSRYRFHKDYLSVWLSSTFFKRPTITDRYRHTSTLRQKLVCLFHKTLLSLLTRVWPTYHTLCHIVKPAGQDSKLYLIWLIFVWSIYYFIWCVSSQQGCALHVKLPVVYEAKRKF